MSFTLFLSVTSFTITLGQAPTAPIANAASGITATSFTASWSSVAGATEYRIDASVDNFTTFVSGFNNLQIIGFTSVSVTGLTAAQTYSYRVRAINSSGTSPNSNTRQALLLPDAPVATTASSVEQNSFYANWNAVPGVFEYRVDVSYNNFSTIVQNNLQVGAPNTTVQLSGFPTNQTVYYRVRAVNSTGASANSQTITVLTLPAAPGIAAATSITPFSFVANWTASPGAIEYYIDVLANGVDFVPGYNNRKASELPGTTLSRTISGLTPGTYYYYYVRASNATGSSFATNMFVTTVPETPTATAATNINLNGFTARWPAVTSASSYKLDVSPDNFTTFVSGYNNLNVSGSATSYSVGGLNPGQTYYYRLRTTGVSGTSSNSNTISLVTLPSGTTATTATGIGSTGFVANWGTVSGASEYYIDVTSDPTFTSFAPGYNARKTSELSGTATSRLVTGISGGTTYYYRLRTGNVSGISPTISNPISVLTIPDAPIANPPTNIVQDQFGNVSFTASWSAVAGGASYRLDVSTSPDFTAFVTNYNNRVVGNVTSFTVAGLVPNTTYYFRVRAVNLSGTSANSNTDTSRYLGDWITSPNGAEVFRAGATIPITINTSRYNPTKIRVEVYAAGVKVFPSTETSSSTLISTVGFPISGQYKVRIYDESNPFFEDWSDAFFSVAGDMNYVQTTSVQVPNVTNPSNVDALPIGSRLVDLAFTDGLGNPIQEVSVGNSPSGRDIVTHHVYDALGRQWKDYNTYSTNSWPTWYKPDANNQYDGAAAFYAASGDPIADDTYPYTETVYETSPTSRVLKNFGAGADWRLSGSGKPVSFRYLFNVHNTASSMTGEKVIALAVSNSTGLPIRRSVLSGYIETNSFYSTGQLVIRQTIDEDGKMTRTYSNKSGQLILKKTQLATTATNLNDGTQWASTYFIYDDLGRLRYVITPLLSKSMHDTDTFTPVQADLDLNAYQYKYDGRGRMIQKKNPMTGPVSMVYDQRDRLVLIQEGKLVSCVREVETSSAPTVSFWRFQKYDQFNRLIMVGMMDTTNGVTPAQMQAAVDLHYTKLSSRAAETYIGSAAGNIHGYTNKSYPVRTSLGITSTGSLTGQSVIDPYRYVAINYYDNYDFKSLFAGDYSYVDDELSAVKNGITYQTPTSTQLMPITTGRLIGTKRKVIDNSEAGKNNVYLRTVSYFDNQGRIVETVSMNHTAALDRGTALFDFAGNVLKTRTTHNVGWRDITAVDMQPGNFKYTVPIEPAESDAGAASFAVLPADQDGWMEFTVTETNTARNIGFSSANTDNTAATITYRISLGNTGTVNCVDGISPAFTPITYANGDKFRIEKVGNQIKYYRTVGTTTTLLRQVTMPTVTQLLVDVCAQSSATISNIINSFSPAKVITKTLQYDAGGRLTHVYHKFDNNPEILLVHRTYDELGRLMDKRLHSTLSSGADAKQSIDYRYNIRGWISSINNASLNQDVSNDDANDYFGINLMYQQADAALGNSSSYNGNVSAIKWGTIQETSSWKQKGYVFSYDGGNRLLTSTYKANVNKVTPAWSSLTNNGYAENLTYDLNGNIKTIQRNDDRTSGWMDNLSLSNNLNQPNNVSESGDQSKGYIGSASSDMTWDSNGNISSDKGRGIGSNGSNYISYTYFNQPWSVTKGTSTLRSGYTSDGFRLWQKVIDGNSTLVSSPQKMQRDYLGEFVYDNQMLKFIGHEEGRIIVGKVKNVARFDGTTTSGVTSVQTNLSLFTGPTGETYLKAVPSTSSTSGAGIFPVLVTGVTEGSRYLIRFKGYRDIGTGSGSNAALKIKIDGQQVSSRSIPRSEDNLTTETWVEQEVYVPIGKTLLEVGVGWVSSAFVTEAILVNAMEIVKLEGQSAEYQYDLKDHLNNVRTTFTTVPEIELPQATLEENHKGEDRANFLRYDQARRVSSHLFDRTNGINPTTTAGYSQRLNGSTDEKIGLARSIAVLPGDVVNMKVYVKYVDPVQANWTAALNTLMGYLGNPVTAPAGTIIDGAGYSGNGSQSVPWAQVSTTGSTGTGPKVFLSYIAFDKNFQPIWDASQTNFVRMHDNAGKENGADVAFDLLEATVTVKQAGTMYIYLTNLESTPLDAFFDDFQVTHTKTPIIQTQDYYAYGLTFNDEQREGKLRDPYLQSSKELQDKLDFGWYDFGSRLYMPELGRWRSSDSRSEKYRDLSPYSYAANNPMRIIDPDGNDIIDLGDRVEFTGRDLEIMFNALKARSKDSDGEGTGLKFFFIYEKIMPEIYKHTVDAFKAGHPEKLTYDTDLLARKRRRAAAMVGKEGIPDNQRDEYPYASTLEGGAGASVRNVKSSENSAQGGYLSAFYKNLVDREQFWVVPVPKDGKKRQKQPAPENTPMLSPTQFDDPEAPFVPPIIPVPAPRPVPVAVPPIRIPSVMPFFLFIFYGPEWYDCEACLKAQG